jgi:purine nucleoside phosphorylase
MIGIISGSALEALTGVSIEARERMETPYGEHSGLLARGQLRERAVVLLRRHGEQQEIAPHRVNYRANLWALHALGVRRVIAVNTGRRHRARSRAGNARDPRTDRRLHVGSRHTFYDTEPVSHAEFTHPYAESLRLELIAAAERAGVDVQLGGIYGATQGPRLETAAEIDRLERDGCDIVGMTGMPEPRSPASSSSTTRASRSSSIARRGGAARPLPRRCRATSRRAWRAHAGCSGRS